MHRNYYIHLPNHLWLVCVLVVKIALKPVLLSDKIPVEEKVLFIPVQV